MKLRKGKALLFTLIFSFVLMFSSGIALLNKNLEANANDVERTDIQTASRKYALVLDECELINISALKKIVDPNGNEVAFTGKTFTPLVVGVYTLIYEDDVRFLNVLYESKNIKFTFDNKFTGTYNAGEKIAFPSVMIQDDYTTYENYNIIISYQGEVVRKVTNVTNADEFGYRFQKSGTYEIKYECEDIFGQVFYSEALSAEVIDVPIILCDPIPSRVQNLSTIDLGFPYGYYKQELYSVDIYVTYPNGEQKQLHDSYLTVNTLGDYKCTYQANIAGEKTTKEQAFEVVAPDSAWSVTSGTVEINQELPAYAQQAEGTAQLLKSNSEFQAKYFNVVDLSKLTKEDNLISFIPYSTLTSYMGALTLTLTDIYDPSNYLEIYMFNVPRWGTGNSFITVVRNGTAYGISNETATFGKLRAQYGSVMYDCSFRGAENNKCVPYTIQWDYENNCLYTYYRGSQWLVLDTDDEVDLPLADKFYGFTTGEVYLSLQTSGNAGGGLYMLEVAGQSLAGESEFVDYQNNLILFDKPNPQLPVGAVDYKYPISIKTHINETCVDKPKITSAIYKNGTKITTESVVESFTPEEAGDYEVVWQASYQGQTVQKRVPFTIEDSPRIITMELPQAEKAQAGGVYLLPEFEISGGAGDYQVAYKLSNDDGEIKGNNGEYLLDTGKNVRVLITVTDCIGYTQIFTYTIEIDPGETALVLEESIPHTVRAGAQVVLPDFRAINYATETSLSKKVIINGSQELTSAPYTFTVPETAQLTISYVAGAGTEYEKREDYTVRVIPKVAGISNLLGVSNNVGTFFLENGLVLKTNTQGKLFEMPYALPTEELYFKIAFNENEIAFEKLSLSLIDKEDTNKQVVLRFGNASAGSAELYINNSTTKKLVAYTETVYTNECGDASYARQKYYLFEFVFDARSRCIKTPDGVILETFNSFSNGRPFNGFAGGVAYIDFALENVSGTSSIVIGGVGNQTFGYYLNSLGLTDDDNMGPMIYADDKIIDVRSIFGTKYAIPMAYARDVLQADSNISVTVKDPNGKTLFNRTSMSKTVEFDLSIYGMYTITYEATDTLGNMSKKLYIVEVIDEKAPTLSVAGVYQDTYKLGDTIKIHTATAVDTTMEGMELTVLYQDSYGIFTIVKMGDTVQLKRWGTHKIFYRAVDKFGNVALSVYEFTIEA